MKITQHRNLTSKVSTKKSQRSNARFGDLLASEITPSNANIPVTEDHKKKHPHPQALFEEAAALLDQALAQLTHHDTPSKNTLQAIQEVREQLSSLSEHDAETETLISVESKRIQMLNH